MRQVIRRFLKHLKAEKNASETTIESYQYDLHKFYAYLVKRLGNRFLPGDVTRDHIRDYLMGSQRSVIKSRTVPRHVRGRSQPSDHSSNTPIVQAY
jgi:site-specific recombinase XerD